MLKTSSPSSQLNLAYRSCVGAPCPQMERFWELRPASLSP
ncbi:hypothetical protein NP493_29g02073 [Ridgeia piscesae]|uniref:Uncharacterized protein n=1 Tax=Ridgeia piscesae TaxID=27915 RepID=A0AAD9PCU2_RIDPI|nr:hypothetical protein NP493_29g02073 [Ridgeia piscesae]